jgi:hypothetical protein
VTKVVEKPTTITKVIQVDRCPLELPPIPASNPKRADQAACESAFGAGAICYAAADAATLALTLDALVSLYLARKSCEPAPHGHTDTP